MGRWGLWGLPGPSRCPATCCQPFPTAWQDGFFWRSPKRRMVRAGAPLQPGLLLWQPPTMGGGGGAAAEISGCHLRWCPLPPKFHSVCGLSMDGTNASGEAVGKIQAFSELSRAGTGWGQGVSLLHFQRTAWRLLSRGSEPPCPASSLLKPGLTCHPRDLGTPSMLQARHPSTSQMDPPQIRRCL